MSQIKYKLALTFAGLLVATSSLAQVSIDDAWVAATVSVQKSSAAFMKLKSEQALTLVRVSSPVAGIVEVHSMSMDGGVMKMRRLDKLTLPAGQVVELQRSGNHLMVMDLKQQLKVGESIPLVLTFEAPDKSGHKKIIEQKLIVPVRDVAQAPMPMPMPAMEAAHKH